MRTTQPVVARPYRRLIATIGVMTLALGLVFATLPAGASENPGEPPVGNPASAAQDEPAEEPVQDPAPPAEDPAPTTTTEPAPAKSSGQPAVLGASGGSGAPTALESSDSPKTDSGPANTTPEASEPRTLTTQTFFHPAFGIEGEAVCNERTYEYDVDWTVTSYKLLLWVDDATVDGNPVSVSPQLLPLFHQGHASSTAPGDATSTTFEATGYFAFIFHQTRDLTLPLDGDCVPPKGSVTVEKVVNGVPDGTDKTLFDISVGDDERPVLGGDTETWDELDLGTYGISESGADNYVTTISPDEVTLTEKEPDVKVTVTNTPKLLLTSMCTDTVADKHWMRVRNEHAFDVPYTWDMPGTANAGAGTATPGDTFFGVPVAQPGTTRLFVGDVLVNTKAQNTKPCEGEVTITKHVEGPGPDGAEYTIDVLDAGDAVVESVTLGDGASDTVTLPGTLAPGGYTYHFAESVDHGASSTVFDPEQVVITKDTEASVTVTNTFEPASITVVKETGFGGPEEFTFTFDGGDPFALTDGGEQAFGDLSPGSYEILETALPENWQLSGVDCGDASTDPADDGIIVNLNAGENVRCVFTNIEVSPEPPVNPPSNDGGDSGADEAQGASAEVAGQQTGTLPFTGTTIAGIVVVALAMLGAGLLLWGASRRRRSAVNV